MKKCALSLGFLLLSSSYALAASCSSVVTRDLIPDTETSEVLRLQNFLVKKGLLTATPNGYFGPGTKRAVMAYQDSVGLPDTGNVFAATRQAVNQESCTGVVPITSTVDQQVITQKVKAVQPASCVDLPNNLLRGDENSYVLKLQNYLVKKGLLTSVPNGYYGVGTTAAVKAYQNQQGLKETGDTLTMMREEIKSETCLPDKEVVVAQGAILPEGCSSQAGFSIVTGQSCSTVISLPEGCTSANGYSVTTGASCTVIAQATQPPVVTPVSPVVTQVVAPVATTTELYTSLTLQLTPNSPGLPFIQNSTHVKLATVAIHSPSTLTVSGLTLIVASSSVTSNTISNFTLTDVGQDKILNGGPVFSFSNQTVLANQAKVYEIYGDIGAVTNPSNGFIDFNGVVTLKDNGSTITNVVIPTFTVLLSK